MVHKININIDYEIDLMNIIEHDLKVKVIINIDFVVYLQVDLKVNFKLDFKIDMDFLIIT